MTYQPTADISHDTIIIDSRDEKHHPQIALDLGRMMRQTYKREVTVDQITFGDYSFFGVELPDLGRRPHIGIELSTVNDLVGKLDNNRLAFQISGMMDSFDIVYLMVVGHLIPDREGNIELRGVRRQIKYNRVMAVVDAATDHGVRVLQVKHNGEAAQRIWARYKYWQKPLADHKLFRPRSAIPALVPVGPALDRVLQILTMFEGLGEDRARAGLEFAGSLQTLMVYPRAILLDIPGWGAGTVDSFIEQRSREPLKKKVTDVTV